MECLEVRLLLHRAMPTIPFAVVTEQWYIVCASHERTIPGTISITRLSAGNTKNVFPRTFLTGEKYTAKVLESSCTSMCMALVKSLEVMLFAGSDVLRNYLNVLVPIGAALRVVDSEGV